MMLTITNGKIEDAQKMAATLKGNHKHLLEGMKMEITRAKETLRNLKKHKVAEADLAKQRKHIEKLEANYSNLYWSAPKFRVPVWVECVNGRVLMDWDFMQAVHKKMKDMIISYSSAWTSGRYILQLTYWNYKGVKGLMELAALDYEMYEQFDMEKIPVAAAE